MSSAVLPNLVGIAYPVDRVSIWDTTKQMAISGKESRTARQTYPRYSWTATYNILRADSNAEFQSLLGFYNARQGSFDSFLYTDPDDNAVTGQTIGTGNGSTAAFQLIRALGGFVEPVIAPNVVSAVYLNGISIPAGNYGSPGSTSLSYTSGGSLAGTTYYVRTTWLTHSGTTEGSAESSISVPSNNLLVVNQPAAPPAGASGWAIYVSTTSGAEQSQTSQFLSASSWTMPSSGLISGASYPTVNTTGWSLSSWGSAASGIVTFHGNVDNGVPVTADFTYYWPCRFDQDQCEFSLFQSTTYSVKKLSWKSVKN